MPQEREEAVSTATAALPAYSGPDGPCPRCGLPGAMTEWHWAGPLAPQDMAGCRPPCAGHAELAVLGGEGEHLCRLCLNCGYGWTEACAGQGTAAPPPAICAGLFSLAGGLASVGAGSFLGLLLAGMAFAMAWLAVTVAFSIMAAAGCAVLAGRGAEGFTAHLSRRRADER
jgi:hypothetical protein